MKKLENQRSKKSNGITLIALVITIIVLLILAGVTIATLTGENEILSKASEASEKTELADEKEKVELSALGALAKADGDEVIQENLEKELGEYFTDGKYIVEPGTNEEEIEGYIVTITENDEEGRKYFVYKNGKVEDYIERELAQPEEGIGKDFTMEYGVIEIEFLSGISYNITTIPNHPILKEGMTAITYNETNGDIQEVGNDKGTDWYSYVDIRDGENSCWANAKVTIDGVDSYFVWIPRYAYRIIYFDSLENENAYREGTLTEQEALANNQIVGYSDARGIVDTEGKTKEGVAIQTAISINDKYFKTHPAFEKNLDYGGWSSRLKGIWVAKYEASQVKGTNIPKFQAGASSWRKLNVGNMYTYGQRYSTTLNSHLMKNSEWGAVAYFAESKYGRNGTEITINSNSTYTGGGSGTAYVQNTNQSTTGNIYGIYDLSGGAYEYVSAYYNGGSKLSNGSSFASKVGISTENATVYDKTGANGYKYGDATYETAGWNGDRNVFLNSEECFYVRSGYNGNGSLAGSYYFKGSSGSGTSGDSSFRICLITQ